MISLFDVALKCSCLESIENVNLNYAVAISFLVIHFFFMENFSLTCEIWLSRGLTCLLALASDSVYPNMTL